MLTLAAIILYVSLRAAPAEAAELSEPSWRPIARACATATDEHGGFWPVWARCTIAQIWGHSIPDATIEQCISQVAAERRKTEACNNCGDPVADVINCAVEAN
jgi:hypothetical protein